MGFLWVDTASLLAAVCMYFFACSGGIMYFGMYQYHHTYGVDIIDTKRGIKRSNSSSFFCFFSTLHHLLRAVLPLNTIARQIRPRASHIPLPRRQQCKRSEFQSIFFTN